MLAKSKCSVQFSIRSICWYFFYLLFVTITENWEAAWYKGMMTESENRRLEIFSQLSCQLCGPFTWSSLSSSIEHVDWNRKSLRSALVFMFC